MFNNLLLFSFPFNKFYFLLCNELFGNGEVVLELPVKFILPKFLSRDFSQNSQI